jgi:hypothetical protein
MWTVAEAFSEINSGVLGLPDFQRRFEWTSSDVRAYLSTVLAGLPSGNLMVAENRSLKVRLRPLEGAPELDGDMFTARVLLDGQQRLTTLWQAVNDTGPDRYFVDFAALLDGAELLQDDVVVSTSTFQYKSMVDKSRRDGRVLVPVSALASPSTFYSWLHSTDVPRPSDQMGEVFASQILPIVEYEIPVTMLGGELDLATVAQIFERTNKWGQRLDAFDLLVARLQGGGWSLREAWNDALLEHPEIARVFGDNGLSSISALSLLTTGDVRRNAVLSLPPHEVSQRWSAAIQATAEVAIALLSEGVRTPELVTYDVAVMAMIAARMESVPTSDLLRYYWAASASRRYEVASNTSVVSDFREILRGGASGLYMLEGDFSPEVIARNTRRSSKALWATLIAMMLSHNPLDLETGERLSSADLDFDERWTLRPLAKGGRVTESDNDVPARLRTAGPVFAPRARVNRLQRLGIVRLVEERASQHELFGPSIDECLGSQLLPPSELMLSGIGPREIIDQRARLLFEMIERRVNN